jgi:hypothetical protein
MHGQKKTVLIVFFCGACSGSPAASSDGASAPADAASLPDHAIVDEDGDGLDDARELDLARRYLPYLSLSPMDGCPTSGLLVRVSPHPDDPTLVHILYDWLYDADCGLNGHIGDDESFAATIDPARPPPDGIVALKAISHQGTPCERTTLCGTCNGLTPCQTLTVAGVAWPAVWPSRAKHGNYVNARRRARCC